MVSLLLTVIIKAPELITDADTRPAETSATSIRDFFVEKIIHSCAHPTSLEAICGHQHNRALVGTDTGSGVVLSLVPTAYVDDYDEKVEAAPSFTSTDQEARDEVIESIKSENSYKPKYLATRTELPCKVVSDESEVYVYGSKRQHIPVIRQVSALTTDAGKQFQDHLLQDSEGSTSGVDSDSGHHLGGLCISNAAVTEQISTFVAAEAQACSDARSYYSESDSSDDGDDSRSVASVEYKVDPSHLHVFSNGLQNEDPVSPLKMNLFRNLIQHKLVYSARKTTVNYYVPLVKSESLFRDIRALDRIHARETIKVAVLYVGPGQWSEAEILSNSLLDTSGSYRSFVDSLGWQVNLATFQGFTGKLESNGSDGESCPYYADESIEVAFHEAAAMPKDQKDMRQMGKKRHIGNDHVHIIWNESHHNYRPETISGDFGNVQIQIRPLEAGEYGIGIYCDEQIKPFGPLCDGTIVSADALSTAVRATAINGHRRAIQAFFRSFTHPYVIRQQTINQIVDKHVDRSW
ncbi:hypothetical protein H4S03_004659 [Coemansia sp. S3946]|nr:hypothetical protein H4S03_004659 [Coemansia sp. S3946]